MRTAGWKCPGRRRLCGRRISSARAWQQRICGRRFYCARGQPRRCLSRAHRRFRSFPGSGGPPRMGGRGLPRPGCEAEELARFRYRGDLAAEVLNDAHGLLDERGVAGCRFAPGEVHRVLHADAAVATKDEGLRQHGEGMPSGTKPAHSHGCGSIDLTRHMTSGVEAKPYLMPVTIWNSAGILSVPSATRSCASMMSPVLKISSSGFEPAAYMRSAMALMLRGELITAPPPNHCVLRSSVQISGLSSTM